MSCDWFSVAVMCDLIHDSDISLERKIYSMYDEVRFISLDKQELSVHAIICSGQVANNN